MNLKQLSREIDSNTIAIVGSFPDFPFGLTDPIEELSKLALKKKVPLHVDCCLGGFIAAFAEQCGVNSLGKFDFQLPGVTSLSCDPHKYAQAPKGVSVLLFKSKDYRDYAFYANGSWAGGFYATPTIAGSRSGAPIAGAWMALVYHGINGLREQAQAIISGTIKLSNELKKIPEIEVFGNPQLCVVAFRSANKKINIYEVADNLGKKKWAIASLQNPPALHFAITAYNLPTLEDLAKDIKLAVAQVLENPNPKKEGKVALYGTSALLPESLIDEAAKLYFGALLKV